MDSLTSLPLTAGPLGGSSLVGMNSQPANPEASLQAAKEFESVFMSMLIKSMRSSGSEQGLFGKENSDTLGGLFDMYLGRHLASSNSLGITQMMNQYLANQDLEPSEKNHE